MLLAAATSLILVQCACTGFRTENVLYFDETTEINTKFGDDAGKNQVNKLCFVLEFFYSCNATNRPEFVNLGFSPAASKFVIFLAIFYNIK